MLETIIYLLAGYGLGQILREICTIFLNRRKAKRYNYTQKYHDQYYSSRADELKKLGFNIFTDKLKKEKEDNGK